MTEGDDSSYLFLPRIRQELDELPLTDAQKESITPVLLKQAIFLDTNGGKRPPGNLRTDSAFFDFASKLQTVVNHFHADGLTLSDYLRAAVKKPQLFNQDSATLIANINAVTEH